MKKYLLSVAMAVLACLGACKKDNSSPGNGIVGKWYETKLDCNPEMEIT